MRERRRLRTFPVSYANRRTDILASCQDSAATAPRQAQSAARRREPSRCAGSVLGRIRTRGHIHAGGLSGSQCGARRPSCGQRALFRASIAWPMATLAAASTADSGRFSSIFSPARSQPRSSRGQVLSLEALAVLGSSSTRSGEAARRWTSARSSSGGARRTRHGPGRAGRDARPGALTPLVR
jgi:hypothetical protein